MAIVPEGAEPPEGAIEVPAGMKLPARYVHPMSLMRIPSSKNHNWQSFDTPNLGSNVRPLFTEGTQTARRQSCGLQSSCTGAKARSDDDHHPRKTPRANPFVLFFFLVPQLLSERIPQAPPHPTGLRHPMPQGDGKAAAMATQTRRAGRDVADATDHARL